MADDWRSNQYRQSVVAKIDEAIRNSGNPTSKNAIEMESHFYQKAKTREDYLGYLARLLLHVNEISKKNAQQNQLQMQGGPGMQDSMGQGPGAQGIGMAQMGNQSQPSALIAQLNQRQLNSNQGQMGQVGPPQQGHENWDMIGQQNQMLQQQLNMPPQNFNSSQSMNQGMMNQNVLPQQMMGIGQGPQQMQQVPGMMNTRPRMQVPVKMAQNQGGPQAMQQQLGGMLPQQNQFMQQQPNQIMQQQQNQMLQLTQQQLMQQQQRKMEMQGGPGGNMVQRQGAQSHYNVGLSPAGQGIQSVPSPAMSGGGMSQQMAPSPHYVNSPGGTQGIAPSPGSAPSMQRLQPGQQQQVRSGVNMGAPSPGMGSVNTPQNHHMQSNMGGQMDAQMVEDQMYIEKVKELGRKYIEPLRRMIEKIGNEDTEKLGKMRNLLNLLENPQKRVPMDTLVKCESVLEKMDFKKTELVVSVPGSAQPPSVSFAVPIPVKESSPFQPLLEAVAANIKSPLINHTLKRTFGPVVATLSEPCDLDFDYFAPKRRRSEDEDDYEPEPGEVARDILEKEIGTVDRKFVVNVAKETQAGQKGLSVVCKLVDKYIPSVPDMEVMIPENYPFSSPVFQLPESENETNPFHKRVLQNMEARISRMQYTFSLSQLLDIWESSVRQACNPKNPGGDQILTALNKMMGM